ncbi:MAG: c-type cytochrome biogenesis protein CcmI [Usitatibacter sp.]
MAVFWILAASMTVVALAFVLVPLLRARPARGPSTADANLEVLRGQRREIEADIANGTLPAEAREQALADLMGRAQDDLSQPRPEAVSAPGKPWRTAALAIPALAFGMYLAVGNPAASDMKAVAAAAHGPMDDQQIIAMVESLAQKVKDRPDDAQGWALLARSMAALGRFKEASDAFEHLAKLVPGDAQILADYADALGMAQGRKLQGRPYELAKEALKIDPKHRKALALAGTAALDAGDYPAAAAHWQALAGELAPGTPDEAQVQAILGEIREKAAASGKPLAAAPKVAKAPVAAPGASTSVSGSVAVAPAIAGKVSGKDTLFIFARSEGGPRVPLAVVRTSASALPFKFTLDDSQAMAPGVNLSSAQSVRIEARISSSGNATPQPGDFVGTSIVVKPGARDVNIVLDKVLP